LDVGRCANFTNVTLSSPSNCAVCCAVVRSVFRETGVQCSLCRVTYLTTYVTYLTTTVFSVFSVCRHTMAKARREIQKAYRERRKLLDTNYLNKERQRQTKYRKPRSTLSKTVKNKLREQTRRYTAKYRQKLKVSREAEAQTNEIQTSEVLVNAVTPSTSDLNPSKGSALSTPRCTTRSSSASSGEQLVVRFDFGSYARKRLAKRKRSQCLAEARKKIRYLETSLRTANRRKKVLQKRVERLRI